MTEQEEELIGLATRLKVAKSIINDSLGVLRSMDRVGKEEWKQLSVAYYEIEEVTIGIYKELRK